MYNITNHLSSISSSVKHLTDKYYVNWHSLEFKFLTIFVFSVFCLGFLPLATASLPNKLAVLNSIDPTLSDKLLEFQKERRLEIKAELGKELIVLLNTPETQNQYAEVLVEQATVFLDLSDYENSIALAKQALKVANKVNHYTSQMTALNRLAEVYWNLGNLEKALEQLESYLILAQQENMKTEISSALHNIGLIYRHLGALDKTVLYYLQAIEMKEQNGVSSESLAHSYNNIGVVYFDLEDYENAEKSYLKAIKILEKDPTNNLANPLHNLGQLFAQKGDNSTALQHYFSSLEYEKKHNNQSGIAVSLREIGKLYLDIKNLEKATEYLERAKSLSDQLDSLIIKANANLQLGILHQKKNMIQASETLLKQALSLATEAKDNEATKNSHKALYELYSQSSQYKKSLTHFKKYHDAMLDISENEAKQALKNLESQKAIELHKQESEKLFREKQLQQELLDKELSLSRIWLVVAFVIFVTVILIIIVVFMRKNLVQKNRINEELIELDKMKDNFLSTTSHELLTPINGIVGLSQSIESMEYNLSEESKTSLKIINSCGFRLSSLIKNILDMSSLRRGSFRLNKEITSLNGLIEKAVKTLKPLAEEKGLSINCELHTEDAKLAIDPEKIEQVFLNVIGNAIKYTNDGKISIALSIKKGRVTVLITDTGCGISDKDAKYLFEAFSTIDSKNFNPGGAGLGLAVSKSIVDLHDGTLTHEKCEDKGSTFKISLPSNNELV